MRQTMRALLCVLTLSLLLAVSTSAQDVKNGLNMGLPQNGVFDGSNFDTIQLNNGNLHIQIPLWTLPGRGLSASYKYVYDNKGWYLKTQCNRWDFCWDIVSQEQGNNIEWRMAEPFSYQVYHKIVSQPCGTGTSFLTRTNYVLREPDGTKHHFLPDPAVAGGNSCWGPLGTMYADDGTGWLLKVDPSTGSVLHALRKDGTLVNTLYNPGGQWPQSGVLLQDANGNQIIFPGTGETTGTDTLGRTAFRELKYYDSSGNLQTVQVTYTSVTVQTNMCFMSGADVCYEYSGTWQMPYEVILPNGLKYTFTYAQGAYGEPTSVVLPTGAQISWTWGSVTEGGRYVTSRTVTEGGQSRTWTYTGIGSSCPGIGGTYSVIVRDPDTPYNETRTTFTCLLPNFNDWYFQFSTGLAQITKKEEFQGSVAAGQLLRTVQTDYSTTGPRLPIRETTTWNQTNQVTKVETDYDLFAFWSGNHSWGNPVERREYAYGTGAPGALVRKTTFTYLHLASSTYRDKNIANRITSQVVYDGAGVIKAQTTMSYDGTTPLAAPGAPNHDYTNFGTGYLTRGNPTLVQRWLNTTGTWLSTTNVYDELGNLRTSTDPLGHITTSSYTDDWANTLCVPGGVNTQAFVTQITNHVGHRAQSRYFPCTSLVQRTRDENDILASRDGTTQTYDFMNRLDVTTFADGGQTDMDYFTSPISVRSKKLRVPGQWIVSYSYVDGLGRISQEKLCEDGQDACAQSIKTDTTYDALGRKLTVTNPYRTTSDTTYGITKFKYDALNRTTRVIPPDGNEAADTNVVKTEYSGNATTVTDQAGKQRRSFTDALGRLIQVDEPNPTLGTPAITTYTYDTLDNLTQVLQSGSRQRTFVYNSLSQLTSATNPESGTISYTYDNDGNLLAKVAPKPNQTNPAVTLTSTYAYDALHRLTSKTFSDGTPTQALVYDVVTAGGQLNLVGRLSRSCWEGSYSNCDYFYYDTIGRVARQDQGGGLWPFVVYTYNLVGGVTQLDYYEYYLARVRSVGYTHDLAGRVSRVQELNGPQKIYADNITYHPHGAVSSMTLSNGAMQQSSQYSPRLQPQSLTVTKVSPPSTVMSFTYTLTDAQGKNNGNVQAMNDTVQALTYGFQYDELNRLARAETTNSNLWGNTYTYDIWGNLYRKDQIQGKQQGEYFQQTMNTKNQFVGWSYDAAGNLLNDGGHNYQYDPEGRIKCMDAGANCASPAASYVYSVEGRRVKRTVSGATTLYLHDGGSVLSEFTNPAQGSGTWQKDYIYLNGQLLATESATDGTRYHFSDHLGTPRVVTNADATWVSRHDYYPYGKEITAWADGETHKFTGKERDSESPLDYFLARYHSPVQGRFLSPDPENAGALEEDPQRWNGYSYARNNPLLYTDPDGTDVQICVDGADCYVLTDSQYKELLKVQQGQQGITLPEGKFPTGDILCSGDKCGTVQYIEYSTGSDILGDTLIFASAGGLVNAGRGLLQGLLGTGARQAATRAALGSATDATGAATQQVIASGTKAAVREAVESGAINSAQRAAVKSALNRAGSNATVTVERLGDGSIRVLTQRAGRVGQQVLEKVIDGNGNTVSVVQKAYDAAGNLVHVDPKFP